jgi:hypothetical protein
MSGSAADIADLEDKLRRGERRTESLDELQVRNS